MACIYSNKLLTLIICLTFSAIQTTGQTWIEVSSQTPSPSSFSSSGDVGSSIDIAIETPGFYLGTIMYEGKTCQLPQLVDGYPILSAGNPGLQKLSFNLQLPASGNMAISILSADYNEYSDIDIPPSEGNTTRDSINNPVIRGEVYNTDDFYPLELIGNDKPFIIRNTRAMAINLYPFRYNPVTRVLRFYYRITFRIINTGDSGDNPLLERDSQIRAIDGIAAGTINQGNSTMKSGQLPSSRGSMVIICPADYIESVSPLAEWRKQTGITTEIIDASRFSGAEDIYNFVRDYYYTKGDLAYLLLVGDAEQVPPYMYSYGASDNYYSYLSGNDHYPDILVGRFSAESVKDVEVQVSRTLQYEKNPGQNPDWITTATGIGSLLSPGDDGESDFQHIRNLLKTLKTTTYKSYNEFFDGSQGEADSDGNPTKDEIVTKINTGTGVIFYTGHGSPVAWATGVVSRTAVENLNNHGKYPLIWSVACETGNFAQKYCLAEAWLRATDANGQPSGALAALMASGTQTCYPPMEAQDKIAELMSNPHEDLSTMGAISVKGMMSMNDIYGNSGYATTDTWILFGDPSLRIRTTIPEQFKVEHKATIGSGKTSFSLKCNSAEGYACISQGGEILGTAAIDAGLADINLVQPVSGDNLTLTITSLNYLPYIATISIVEKPEIVESSMPLNHSKLQPINSNFSWDGSYGGNPEYYLFYLGTDNPPTNLINGQIITEANLKTQFNLKYDTKYYWKVTPVNSYGNAEGKVMDFSTVFRPDEDFESVIKSQLQWSSGGMQKWTNDGTTFFDGKQSLRSGQINDNEFSSLIYPCEVKNCDFVSFWSKTSCDPGDKLQFIIDGIVIQEWSGYNGWNFHIFKVAAGMHQLEWRYLKDGNVIANDDAVWLDDIHLPQHAAPAAMLSESGSVCEASAFETAVIAENYFSVIWQASGDGSFDDKNLENPLYYPGILDMESGSTILKMHVQGFDGCPALDKEILLEISSIPIITLPSDTIISEGNTIQLDAGAKGDMNYSWEPSGNTGAIVILDSTLSVDGIKTERLTVTNSAGCSVTKDIRIHFNNQAIADLYKIFPNPSNGNFILEPVNGAAVIDQMMLVDQEGKVMWRDNTIRNIVGNKQLSISGLSRGTYFLVSENIKGRSVNPVMIQ